jgi:hypothetical protein
LSLLTIPIPGAFAGFRVDSLEKPSLLRPSARNRCVGTPAGRLRRRALAGPYRAAF